MLFVSYELEPVPILVRPTHPWERIREESDKSKATCQMWSEAESGVPLGLPIHNLRFSVNQPWKSQFLHHPVRQVSLILRILPAQTMVLGGVW